MYVVVFFKVVQQQTIGKVENSAVCGQIISVCSSEKNYKNRSVFAKVMLKIRVQFSDLQCT